MTIPKLYTLDEVATITRSPRSTVNHWVYTQRLSAVKVGRHRLVSEHTLRKFLQLDEVADAS